MRNSVLIITEEDIRNFDALLEQTGEEVHFFTSFDRTELACTIVRPKSESKGSVLWTDKGSGADNDATIYYNTKTHGFIHA